MTKNAKPPPTRTRTLTGRDCLSRALLFTVVALSMAVVFVLDWDGKDRQWLFLGLAAFQSSFAWRWWRRYFALRRGNRTTGFDLLGVVSGRRTVTTTIQIAETASPRLPSAVSALALTVLTVLALVWAVLSVGILVAPGSSAHDRLFAGTMDVLIGAFILHCWRRVGEDSRSQPPADD